MKLVLRSERKMFMGVAGDSEETIYRLKGFSSLSESKNPVEYSTKYVDETNETTYITGMSPSYEFTFDMMKPNPVLTDIAGIIDGEKLGDDAVRSFYEVDFSESVTGGYKAKKIECSVIGDTVGDGTDALTYSGTLKVVKKYVSGVHYPC